MIVTIDFETMPIENGSAKSPAPIGVSIKMGDTPSLYTRIDDMTLATLKAITSERKNKLVFHNAKFDLRVMLEHCGIPLPDSEQIVDTMIMAYLVDPREPKLGLKELAHKYCGIAPDERDELQAWLKAHNLGNGEIYRAPFETVKRYAENDTDITYALYKYYEPLVIGQHGTYDKQTITDAFNREMALIPIVIEMEQRGVTISERTPSIYQELQTRLEIIDDELHTMTDGTKPGSKAMFEALRNKGYIDESKIQYTAKGNARYGREFLESYVSDQTLLGYLTVRSKLVKLIGTYFKPFAEAYPTFYPYYNQTRSESDYGTRTGRFSSNIQQLPKEHTDKSLPSVRSSICAMTGYILIRRDFSQQEIRVAAHYAEGDLLAAYNKNPRLDVHTFIQELIHSVTGIDIPRTVVKTIVFMKFYGGGATKLAGMLNISVALAKEFFDAFDEALPSIKALMRDVEAMSRRGQKIRTWGGRSYDVEIAEDGREFYYKLGNVLIQGSSADMTKEAMIRYYYHPNRMGRIFMQVHDEIVVEVPERYADGEMVLLQWAMDEIQGWDVPLLSEGFIGYNLGEMEAYHD